MVKAVNSAHGTAKQPPTGTRLDFLFSRLIYLTGGREREWVGAETEGERIPERLHAQHRVQCGA